MGVVIIEGFKNRELGVKQFAAALAIEPGIAMTPALVTPGMSRGVRRGQGAGGTRWTAIAPERRLRRAAGTARSAVVSGGFTYHTVSEVKQGNAITHDRQRRREPEVPQGRARLSSARAPPSSSGARWSPAARALTAPRSPSTPRPARRSPTTSRPRTTTGSRSPAAAPKTRPLVIQLGGEARPSDRVHHRAQAAQEDRRRQHQVVATAEQSEGETAPAGSPACWWASGFGTVSGHGERTRTLPVTRSVSPAPRWGSSRQRSATG